MGDQASSCYHKALYRLSVGDMTEAEMTEYLTDPKRKNTGFPEEVALQTVLRLREEGFLDDKRYLLRLVRRGDESLVGPRRLREELIRHRFPSRYVEAVMARSVDYDHRARKLLVQKGLDSENLSTPAARKKAVDFLVRRGYSFGVASEAVRWISKEYSD